jgi:isoleucyl-tRNA synthetase
MVDYLDDVRLSDEILDRNAEAYRKIRNTFRYFLGNLHDFDPARDAVPPADLPEMDLWALDQVNAIIARAREGYEGFEFHTVHHALHNFCAVEMSSLYLDVVKDRLYVESADSPARRAAQTVLYRAAESLCLLMAPILPFTAEEVWRELPGREGRTGSVHLALLPERLPLAVDGDFRERWKRLLSIREKVTAAIEIERQAKRIGQALEAVVTIRASGEPLLFLRRYAGEIGSLFIVSKVVLEEGSSAEPEITVSRAPGVKCARCWHTLEDVGRDPENPTLCGRCAPIVRRLGEIRGS